MLKKTMICFGNVVRLLITAKKKENWIAQITSVWWNADINKTKSQVNYFAISLSNPNSIISFARNNNLLDKMLYCHLTQYCRSNISVDVERILKVSTSPAGIKYKFGIQVPRRIKNSINLDKNIGK
jgi:hypothetical protein